jgi:protoporphyrinogen/coproporphyrinogen III oxidase
MKITILGGGITGLTLAYLLQDTHDVTLIEKTGRLGGWIETYEKEGFLFELGPRGFRPHGEGAATLDLCQKLGLSPLPCNHSAKRRFVLSKGRLRSFGLPYLLECGLLSSLWKDFWVQKGERPDESLYSFFSRHLHPKMVEGVLDPVVKGIFAGELNQLSIESCFPVLKGMEKTSGSLLCAKREKKKSKLPALYSFKGGMEQLPKTIAERLKCKVMLNTTLEKVEADLVISTLPLPITGELFGVPFSLPFQSLTTISCGWKKHVLPKKGFGYLVPKQEQKDYLGMTWDSYIFDQPNFSNQERICVMCEGILDQSEALRRADRALKDMGVGQKPDVQIVNVTSRAIAHFPVGHFERVEAWKKKLPYHVKACGSSVGGKGVNGCIQQATDLVRSLSL